MHREIVQFVHLLPEPSFLIAGTGIVLVANHAAASMLGIEGRSLADAQLASFIHQPPAKVHEYLRLCARSRQLMPGSFTWDVKGAPHDMRCDAAVLTPKTETEPAVLFLRCRPKAEATDQFALLNQKIADLSRQIVERKKAEQQRDDLLQSERAARLEAETNSRLKDEFLATVSHELRTPLNAILGWAQLLEQSGPVPESVSEGLAVITRNARAQSQLINDLLDMSRIISGKVRLDVQRVELQRVIEAAVDSVRPAAEAKRLRLQVTLDPIAGPVKGDPSRLQQVVWNLLANAVKFTPKEGRVQVFLERVNSHLEIVVSDTGEGIRPEFLPHVFERFRQSDATTTRRHGGLGLGLSIVKQLVELHGGSVRAKSPGEGKGSTFIVMLPLLVVHNGDQDGLVDQPRVHPASEKTPRNPCDAADLSNTSVLIVDDEADARGLVREILARCGAQVLTAASAAEAIEVIRTQRPNVLISDIGMPDADGYELLRRVRQLPPAEGGRTPAIALTAFARSEDRTHALIAGFNVHISKPLEPPELMAAVASLAGLLR